MQSGLEAKSDEPASSPNATTTDCLAVPAREACWRGRAGASRLSFSCLSWRTYALTDAYAACDLRDSGMTLLGRWLRLLRGTQGGRRRVQPHGDGAVALFG